jgi:sugar/nucleoside kinase (ribokinase family)
LVDNKLSSKRVLAFGNPVFDLITTPVVSTEERILSGCSTNACLAISRLGYPSTLIGGVGADYKARLEREMHACGIKTLLFQTHQTGGFALNYLDDQGNRTLSILGIADPLPSNLIPADDAEFILLGPILGEIPLELVKNLRRKYTAPILLDPQGLLRGIRDGNVFHELSQTFKDIAALSTIIKANEVEAFVATGINPRLDPESAVRALYKYGCKIAVVTLAEAGSIIYDGHSFYIIPPYTTNALDPTGAGDTYAAGFIVKYMETPGNLTAVGCFASAVASVMVENIGPEFPLTRQEADHRAEILQAGPLQLKL